MPNLKMNLKFDIEVSVLVVNLEIRLSLLRSNELFLRVFSVLFSSFCSGSVQEPWC